jgi:hypothetical protein
MVKKIKIDRELYDKFHDMMDNQSIINKMLDEYAELRDKVDKYMELYMNTDIERVKLVEENKIFKDLFDKEQDTQVIKYQGKIYKIISTAHFSDLGEEDTIDINAVCVEEVNKDGKSEM